MNPLVLLQRFLLQYKKQIIWMFLVVEIAVILFELWGGYLYLYDQLAFFSWYSFGSDFGRYSFYLYCTTLVPGILKRFRILPVIQGMIVPFRRHIGITMFLMAIVHMSFTTMFFLLLTWPIDLSTLRTHQFMGFFAVLCLFPLWVTSNDYSMRLLKHNWTVVHRLTYVACFFIFMHLTFVEKNLAKIGAVFIFLEVTSWLKFFIDQRRQAAVQTPVAPPASPTPPTQSQV